MRAREAEIEDLMTTWEQLTLDLQARHQLNLAALRPAYKEEHRQYLFRQGWQGQIPAASIRGKPQFVFEVFEPRLLCL